MTTNIEIKARIRNQDRLKKIVMTITSDPGEVLEQEDTFFHSPFGRLKLRFCKAGDSKLIFYQRGTEKGR